MLQTLTLDYRLNDAYTCLVCELLYYSTLFYKFKQKNVTLNCNRPMPKKKIYFFWKSVGILIDSHSAYKRGFQITAVNWCKWELLSYCRDGSAQARCLCWMSTVQGMGCEAATGTCPISMTCWSGQRQASWLIPLSCTTALLSAPPTCTVTGKSSFSIQVIVAWPYNISSSIYIVAYYEVVYKHVGLPNAISWQSIKLGLVSVLNLLSIENIWFRDL